MTNNINDTKDHIFNDLKHKHYGIYGNHSAVEICEWNKKAIRDEGVCYKQKFYNIDTHRCAQITPAVIWCHQNCTFCWRPTAYMRGYKIPGKLDEPKDIIDGLFEERRKLLTGFGGLDSVDKTKFKEALIPSHVAISLAGEPTIYSKLAEMIQYLKSKPEIKSIFVVTNGLEPDRLKELNEKNSLPIQLYLSIEAPNKQLHLEINKPKTKDSWEKFNETIDLYPSLNCRKIVRFTLIKGINDSDEYLDDFIKLIEKTNTDFVEIKAYMYIGESRQRLKKENMPSHDYVREYSEKFAKKSKLFDFRNEQIESRIVLLKNKNSKVKDFIK